LRVYTLVYNCT